ncbi:hypothetical protein D3C71_1817430 [compost metagenome]
MVILDFGRIADEFVPFMDQIAVRALYPFVIGSTLQCREGLMHLRDILFRYIIGVRPRV